VDSIQAFLSKRMGKLVGGVFFVTLSFSGKFKFSASSQHDPPAHKCLFRSLVFGCVKEYFRTTHTLAPFSPTPTSSNTTSTFITLHPNSNGYLLFLKDYELDQKLKLSYDSFKLTFQHMPHLLASGPFGMIFECFQDYFHPEYSTNGFPQ
jgi:hypothetical protein